MHIESTLLKIKIVYGAQGLRSRRSYLATLWSASEIACMVQFCTRPFIYIVRLYIAAKAIHAAIGLSQYCYRVPEQRHAASATTLSVFNHFLLIGILAIPL